MIPRGIRLLLPVLAGLVSINFAPASGQENCRLLEAKILRGQGGHQLKTGIACQDATGPDHVRYPAGPLFVGLSLYRIEQPAIRKAITRFHEWSGTPWTRTNIVPIELPRPAGLREISFELGDAGAFTHFVVAVWDQKNPCQPDTAEAESCAKAGGTLGFVDSLDLPVPVDTWPRPVCDVRQLTNSGFFEWVERAGDVAGSAVPDRYRSMLHANDCWTRFADRPGLGYSLRQWRLQPMP